MTTNQTTTMQLSVPASLSGKRVLLTGATGFLAKVVLEKLIRTVPDIGSVILLIRGKDNDTTDGAARERFQRQVATSSIFDTLRAERAECGPELARFFAEKLECVTGEVTEPNFGLGAERFLELAARTDLVINAAASVNFREPLDQALQINTLSLHHLTALARAADAPLVQVSTCYVNGYRRGDIREEAVHPAGRSAIPRHRDGGYDVEALIARLQRSIARVKARTHDAQRLEDALTALGIREANRHGWNDTYTFTKWMGEQLAMRGMRGRPLTIVRPSIIESTLRGPVPGWLEGVKVADAVILAYARGRTSFFPARPGGIIDIIPADLVANSVLMAGAEALASPPRHRIYQCCSGSGNPILVGELIRLLQGESQRNWRQYDKLFHKQPRHAFRVVGNVRFRLAMAGVALGALAWSGLRRLAGAPGETPAMEKLRTTRLLAITFSFYARPRYRFHTDGLLALARRFGQAERALYPVDARLIDWEDYLCRVHMPGLNRYALKRKEARAAQALDHERAPLQDGVPAPEGLH
jgi:nucleoside-diphosphate-sugar epimerase